MSWRAMRRANALRPACAWRRPIGSRPLHRQASGAQPARRQTETEIGDLIRRMSRANPLWGAPRIHGELLKLGIEISQARV
jgi:hypothetical protein